MSQINRIKLLAGLLVFLTILAWFALQKKLTVDTISSGEESIGIADTSSIEKVTIFKKNETQTLTRSKSGWMVNGKYKTRELATSMLMVGLNQLQVKRPVSEESRAKVIQLLNEKGARVVVEMEEEKKELIFASNENDVNSTYLMIPGSDKPVIAYVPGVPGDINNLFRFTENDWRTRTLFSSQPNHIQSLKISYPQDPASNVEISYARGNFDVKGVSVPDTSVLYQFVPVFQNLQITRYLDSKDSLSAGIMNKSPFALIELQDLDQEKSNSLAIFKTPDNHTEYYGRIGKSGEAVALRKDIFSQLLLKKNDFVKR